MKRVAMLVVGLFLMPMLGGLVVPAVAPVVTGSIGCFDIGDEYSIKSYEATVTASQAASMPQRLPWWVDLVDANGLSHDGDGVYIAVLDTGLRSNWDDYFIEDQISTTYGKGFSHDITWDDDEEDFVMGGLNSDRGYITNDIGSGHGTHVTSTIIGYRLGSAGWMLGVAPKATIIPVLVLDTWLVECPSDASSDYWSTEGPYGGFMRLNGGSDAMVEAGIEYVTGLAKDELKDSKIIISMSLGGPVPNDDIEDAIDDAIDAGVIVVASAGNNGVDGMGWPGAYSQVISVAAAGWSDYTTQPPWGDVPEDLETEDVWGNDWQIMIMPFSSRPVKSLGQRNSDLDLTDPGYWVLGPFQIRTWWSGSQWVQHTDVYHKWYYWFVSGTSMAAPHCSAIASIVQEWSQDSSGGDGVDITQKHMEHILENAATKNWPPASYKGADYYSASFSWDRADWGKGLLQADEALDAAEDYVDENY